MGNDCNMASSLHVVESVTVLPSASVSSDLKALYKSVIIIVVVIIIIIIMLRRL